MLSKERKDRLLVKLAEGPIDWLGNALVSGSGALDTAGRWIGPRISGAWNAAGDKLGDLGNYLTPSWFGAWGPKHDEFMNLAGRANYPADKRIYLHPDTGTRMNQTDYEALIKARKMPIPGGYSDRREKLNPVVEPAKVRETPPTEGPQALKQYLQMTGLSSDEQSKLLIAKGHTASIIGGSSRKPPVKASPRSIKQRGVAVLPAKAPSSVSRSTAVLPPAPAGQFTARVRKGRGYGNLAARLNKQLYGKDWQKNKQRIRASALQNRMQKMMLHPSTDYSFSRADLTGTGPLTGGLSPKRVARDVKRGSYWRQTGRPKYLAKREQEALKAAAR